MRRVLFALALVGLGLQFVVTMMFPPQAGVPFGVVAIVLGLWSHWAVVNAEDDSDEA